MSVEWAQIQPNALPDKRLNVATLKLRELFQQFSRYLAVGGLAFVVDFAVLSGLLLLHSHYLVATMAGFAVGLVTNYLLCIWWVWNGTQAKSAQDFLVFSLIGLGGLLLTLVLMWIGVDLFGANPQWAKAVIAGIVLLWNFGLRRVLVFFK